MKTSTAEPRTTACAIDAERSSNKAFFENADKPTLHGLSYALRHPDTWPENFVWDFDDCTQCAMGLAHELWRELIPKVHRKNATSVMAKKFSMPYAEAQHIFMSRENKKVTWGIFKSTPRFGSVTPDMVADQIDKYIATAE